MWLGFLEHQEESGMKNSSRIEEKQKLGEECELLFIKDRKILVLFRRFSDSACTSFL